MDNSFLISIVTPCYNASRFIGETIESVQKQTYINWELLIVDDGSKDNSEEIVYRYIKTDNRIKYFKLPQNTGSPAAPRNYAIEKAKGDFIAFLDADDLWKPDKLEKQIDFATCQNCSIVYSDGEIIDENGRFVRNMRKVSKADYKHTLKHDELSCSAVLIKKELLNGCYFQKGAKEDLVFWLDVLGKTNATAYNVGDILYSYRIVSNSRSRNKLDIVKQQWVILRKHTNLSIIGCIYNFAAYLWLSFKKYYWKK